MRTKILLLTAALSAAGVATSMAQGTVFSVNAVGYVNVDVNPGFALIANPLQTSNNTVAALFPNVPDGTTVYKFSNGGFNQSSTFLFGSWADPSLTLDPGDGAFISNPTTANMRLTFVGEVLQGTLSNSIPLGFSIKASKVPQAGPLDGNAAGELQFPVGDGDTVYKFNKATQKYTVHYFLFGSWSGDGRPSVDVGEAFFVNKSAAANWVRTFSVNP